MTNGIDEARLAPDRARRLITEWFAGRNSPAAVFTEETSPDPDPDDSYALAYEAVFEPSSSEYARIVVSVTTEGEVAIGLERCGRVADRLGVNCILNGRQVFAAGHEPLPVSEAGLIALLDLVADGQLAISATVAPLLGILHTGAVLPNGAVEALVSKGYSPLAGYWAARNAPPRPWRRLLRYDKW